MKKSSLSFGRCRVTAAFAGSGAAGATVVVPVADWGFRADAFDAPFEIRAELRSLDRDALGVETDLSEVFSGGSSDGSNWIYVPPTEDPGDSPDPSSAMTHPPSGCTVTRSCFMSAFQIGFFT